MVMDCHRVDRAKCVSNTLPIRSKYRIVGLQVRASGPTHAPCLLQRGVSTYFSKRMLNCAHQTTVFGLALNGVVGGLCRFIASKVMDTYASLKYMYVSQGVAKRRFMDQKQVSAA